MFQHTFTSKFWIPVILVALRSAPSNPYVHPCKKNEMYLYVEVEIVSSSYEFNTHLINKMVDQNELFQDALKVRILQVS